MKQVIQLGIALILTITTITTSFAQVGIGTENPTNTLHVTPANPNEDALRIEGLNEYMTADSSFMVVDPATGVVRQMPVDSFVAYLNTVLRGNQDASEVDMAPNLDINGDGTTENTVQESIEVLADDVPKGVYRSIFEARLNGLQDGDTFIAHPQGVFGCSGCRITLQPGM